MRSLRNMNDLPIVMICDNGQLARVVKLGAHVSWLAYDQDGQTKEEMFFNEDVEFMEAE